MEIDENALERAYEVLAECENTTCQECHDAARVTIATYLKHAKPQNTGQPVELSLIEAIQAEKVAADETNDPTDIAYNNAVDHCTEAAKCWLLHYGCPYESQKQAYQAGLEDAKQSIERESGWQPLTLKETVILPLLELERPLDLNAGKTIMVKHEDNPPDMKLPDNWRRP